MIIIGEFFLHCIRFGDSKLNILYECGKYKKNNLKVPIKRKSSKLKGTIPLSLLRFYKNVMKLAQSKLELSSDIYRNANFYELCSITLQCQ